MAVTKLAPQLVRSTGTLTVEDVVIEAQGTATSALAFLTAADSGNIATETFSGHNSAAADTDYARTVAAIVDNTDTSEDGSYSIETSQAGSLTNCATFATGLTMNGATGGDQGSGTINATGLFVDGVAVSTSTGDVTGPGSSTDNAVARYDSTTGKIIQNSGVTIDDSDNMTVPGDLTVNGTLTTLDTTNLAVEDSLIQLARNNNATDTLDIGFVGLYDTSGSQDLYAGMFRDATDNKFKLFVDSQEDLSASNTVNTAATGYTTATLVADLEGDVTGTASGNVANTLFDANTILKADTDDTPAALTVPEQTLVGRITAGSIDALTATEVRTLLNVEDGAEANLDWQSQIYVETTDYTEGVTTSLTLPVAAPSDDEDHVRVYYTGLKQAADTWSISGTTITFSEAIPVGVDKIEIHVLA